MFSPVWDRVVRGNYRASSASLKGYSRFAVIDETYPVIVPGNPEQVVEGVLYFDVDLADVARLDVFEGKYYLKKSVELMAENRQSFQAQAYVLNPAYQNIVSESSWNPEHFYCQDMFEFIDAYCGFEEAD